MKKIMSAIDEIDWSLGILSDLCPLGQNRRLFGLIKRIYDKLDCSGFNGNLKYAEYVPYLAGALSSAICKMETPWLEKEKKEGKAKEDLETLIRLARIPLVQEVSRRQHYWQADDADRELTEKDKKKLRKLIDKADVDLAKIVNGFIGLRENCSKISALGI